MNTLVKSFFRHHRYFSRYYKLKRFTIFYANETLFFHEIQNDFTLHLVKIYTIVLNGFFGVQEYAVTRVTSLAKRYKEFDETGICLTIIIHECLVYKSGSAIFFKIPHSDFMMIRSKKVNKKYYP